MKNTRQKTMKGNPGLVIHPALVATLFTLYAYSPIVTFASNATQTTVETAAVPLFADTSFQRGFFLSATDSSLGRKASATLKFGDDNQNPIWRACQWGTHYDLTGAVCQVGENGDRHYSNDAKTILLGGSGSENRDLILRVNGGVEYGSRARQGGEAWPHLLVEQNAQQRFKLTDLERVELHISLRLLEFNDHMAEHANPALHAAQFQLFFIVKNLNPGTQDYKDFFWFGVPFFDNRHPLSPGHRAKDAGKEDATGKFINTIPGAEILPGPMQLGQWVRIQKDLLPYIHEGLAASKQAGFLSDINPADYGIVNMNMGWEMPGTFDAAMQIRDFNVLAYPTTPK